MSKIRDEMVKVFTGYMQDDAFKAGWDACLKHLLESAPKFDESIQRTEEERLFQEGSIDHWSPMQWGKYFARWQFKQNAAQIAALKAELEELRKGRG